MAPAWEYGIPNEALLEGLRERGAEVKRVPVYRWALPEDSAPLEAAIGEIAAERAQVILFTNATQVAHLVQVAAGMGLEGPLRTALGWMVCGS